MLRYAKEGTAKYPKDAGPEDDYLELKAELTGPEEDERDAIRQAVSFSMSPEARKAVEKKAALFNKTGRELTEADVSDVDVDVEMDVASILTKTKDFDLKHYIVGWSLPDPVSAEAIDLLSPESRKWALDLIKVHRESVPTEADAKN